MSVLATLIDERARWGKMETTAALRRTRARAFMNYAFLVMLFVTLYVFRSRLYTAFEHLTS